MASGFGRILAQLADRYLTEKIANSPTVQRVAFKSVESVKGLKDKAAGNAAKSAQAATQGGGAVRQFLRAMKDEAMKDAEALRKK